MEMEDFVGKRVNLIVRQMNGTNSLYENVRVLNIDEYSIIVEYGNGKIRAEPRLYAALELKM